MPEKLSGLSAPPVAYGDQSYISLAAGAATAAVELGVHVGTPYAPGGVVSKPYACALTLPALFVILSAVAAVRR